MKELNKCAHCGSVLVSHELIHSVKGYLYCSKECAINDIMDDYLTNARELAINAYNDDAEIVRTEDVLAEDLQTVEIVVTCRKRIKVPATMTEAEAKTEAEYLYRCGYVVAEPDDCDDYNVEYTLVKDDNSVNKED